MIGLATICFILLLWAAIIVDRCKDTVAALKVANVANHFSTRLSRHKKKAMRQFTRFMPAAMKCGCKPVVMILVHMSDQKQFNLVCFQLVTFQMRRSHVTMRDHYDRLNLHLYYFLGVVHFFFSVWHSLGSSPRVRVKHLETGSHWRPPVLAILLAESCHFSGGGTKGAFIYGPVCKKHTLINMHCSRYLKSSSSVVRITSTYDDATGKSVLALNANLLYSSESDTSESRRVCDLFQP
jgi:hypothetical protein